MKEICYLLLRKNYYSPNILIRVQRDRLTHVRSRIGFKTIITSRNI
jgi:hypothetical protein